MKQRFGECNSIECNSIEHINVRNKKNKNLTQTHL